MQEMPFQRAKFENFPGEMPPDPPRLRHFRVLTYSKKFLDPPMGLDTIMPERSVRIHETDKPWINANLKLLIKKRQRAFTSGDEFLY